MFFKSSMKRNMLFLASVFLLGCGRPATSQEASAVDGFGKRVLAHARSTENIQDGAVTWKWDTKHSRIHFVLAKNLDDRQKVAFRKLILEMAKQEGWDVFVGEGGQ
ncbi:MAG: hypothetical protein QM755_02325 [Luteolibacter sp.]